MTNSGALADGNKTVENFGPVKKVQVPASWSVTKRTESRGIRQTLEYNEMSPADPDVKMSVVHRGMLEPADSVQYYKTLLAANANLHEDKMLEADDIKKLSAVLDDCGYNQYYLEPDPDGTPAPFQVSFVRLTRVNGKVVIEAAGSFVGRDNKPTDFFRGIYVPADKDCRDFYEVYLITKTKEKFLAQVKSYENLLKSIVW